MADIFFDYGGRVVHVTVSTEVFSLYMQYKEKNKLTIKQLSSEIEDEYGSISDETVVNFLYSRVLPS